MGQDRDRVVRLVSLEATLLLENGSEVFRVEDTILRICRALGYPEVEIVAFPICFIVTLEEGFTFIRRIKSRRIDLGRIHEANCISRGIVQGTIEIEEAIKRLEQSSAHRRGVASHAEEHLMAGLSSAFFSVLFGGRIWEALWAFAAAYATQVALLLLKRRRDPSFMGHLLSGIVTAAVAVAATHLMQVDTSKVILGGIMPIIPGTLLIISVQEGIRGEIVSCLTRAAEALLGAALIAAGVVMVMKVNAVLGGGRLWSF